MKTYPQLKEVFELTLDGSKDTPLGMVEQFGYSPVDWSHNGPTVMGKQTKKFMLVTIGYQPNLAAARQELEKQYGPTPEGQWLKAFKGEYPESDGNGPVGVADGSWVPPFGPALFPFVRSDGGTDFGWTGSGLDERWRWLVPAPGK